MNIQSATPPAAMNLLARLDARRIAHRANRDLITHLEATHDLLVSWKAPEAVALAGLFHSVYGTDAFEQACLLPGERAEVRSVIGKDAERLAYLFGALERDEFLAEVGSNGLVSRFGDEPVEVSACETRAMCEILLANEIDLAIAKKGTNRPDKIKKKIGPIYALIEDYVSPAAKACYLKVTAQKV